MKTSPKTTRAKKKATKKKATKKKATKKKAAKKKAANKKAANKKAANKKAANKKSAKSTRGPSLEPIAESLLQYIQSLREDIFTSDILVPLFAHLGFNKVEFHGGPYEHGIDMLCWGTDPVTECRTLTAVQVKKTELGAQSKPPASLSEIVTQLSLATEHRVPHADGESQRPNKVLFITPYVMSTRSLEQCFPNYTFLRDRGVTVLDGEKIVKLLRTHCPELEDEVVDYGARIDSVAQDDILNRELMNALDVTSDVSLPTIYTDIHFSIGRRTTRLFLLGEFLPTTVQMRITETEWKELDALNSRVQRIFDCAIVDNHEGTIGASFESYREIERKRLRERLPSIRDKKNAVLEKLAPIKMALNDFKNQMKQVGRADKDGKLLLDHPDDRDLVDAFWELDLSKKTNAIRKTAAVIADMLRLPDDEKAQRTSRQELTKAVPPIDRISEAYHVPKLSSTMAEWQSKYREYDRSTKEEQSVTKALREATAVVPLTGRSLAAAILNTRASLQDEIGRFNRSTPSRRQLSEFLASCKELFSETNVLLNDPTIKRLVGVEDEARFHLRADDYRISIAIDRILETDMNLAVLGEAGAGKTTALKMHAYRLGTARKNAFPIFVPLVRLVDTLNSEECKDTEQPLAFAVSNYLQSRGVKILPADLQRRFSERGGVLLLDGVDEAIKRAPKLLKQIRDLASAYPKLQIVTSSRVSGSYLEEIPFLGITLLPFTTGQRRRFVERWFGSEKKKDAEKVNSHIDESQSLGELLSNPLLTTILCVLQHNEAPLPDNEIRLYDERVRLLLGHYDMHRGVRRVKSRRDDLHTMAEQLAYWLHFRDKRFASREVLIEAGKNILGPYIGARECVLAVSELIDPCEVLVPMTERGEYGFGHLRFQEHLAACAIKNDRNIEIRPLMVHDSWTDTLVLLSRMSTSIDFILNVAGVGGFIGDVNKTLLAMIAARRPTEQTELKRQIADVTRSRRRRANYDGGDDLGRDSICDDRSLD